MTGTTPFAMLHEKCTPIKAHHYKLAPSTSWIFSIKTHWFYYKYVQINTFQRHSIKVYISSKHPYLLHLSFKMYIVSILCQTVLFQYLFYLNETYAPCTGLFMYMPTGKKHMIVYIYIDIMHCLGVWLSATRSIVMGEM